MEKANGTAKANGANSTTIGRLIVMLKESENAKTFYETIGEIKDKEKKDKIDTFIEQKNIEDTIKGAIKDLDLGISEEYFKIYMQTFLNQLKLIKRTDGKNNGGTGNVEENNDKSKI
jgi:hypothetical protein